MKPQHSLSCIAFFMSVLALTSSCQKDKFDVTPINQQQDSGKPENFGPETLEMAATQWEFQDDGSYICNLTNIINKSVKSNFVIVSTSVIVNGQQVFISATPIDYYGYALSSENSRNGYILIFRSSFGEMPFHSLDLKVYLVR